MNFNIAREHRSWFYSAAIAVLITVWLLSGQIGGDESAGDVQLEGAAAIKAPHSKVRVRTQSAEEVVRTIDVNGKTAPARIVELSAETDGRVEHIGVERGASVKRGAIVIRLDERDRRARLAQAEATVKQRELEYDARKSLETKSYVSAAQLQEALAQLEAARTERTRAEVDLDAMTIRAPFDGALQSRIAEVGDFVKRGDPVAIFVDNQTIIVSANLSEFDARYVEVGNSAEARLATGERVRGVIRYVAPVADQATRTFEVELEVDNRDGKLRAGGTAQLYIPAETVKAHRISPSLLTLDEAGTVGLKLINDKGEVEFVAADIALSSSEGIWVAGLPDTATIITVGQGFVTSGSLVDAVPESDIATSVAVKAQDEE
jgi:multidrug efflux system membrane fusion protein